MCWPKRSSISDPSSLPPLNKSVLTRHLSAPQTGKYILARQNRQTHGWTKLQTSILIVSQTVRVGRGKKGRSWEDKRGKKRRKKRRRLLKFLSGCYCPWWVFKAGKGSLHRKMALRMLTVTLHSLWGRHRHLNALGDSCNHFISDTRCSRAQYEGSEMISESDLVEFNFLNTKIFLYGLEK